MNQIFRLFFTLLFTILLGNSFCIFAQPDWQWGKRGGSFGSGSGYLSSEEVLDMATDKNGNVYVLSVHNPGATPNVDGHVGTGIYDNMILASWNCNGTFRWMKTFGTAGNTIAKNLGLDTLGGVYVAGISTSTNPFQYAYFDSDTTLGNTNKGLFLIKYDTSGDYKWLRMPQPDTASATSLSFNFPYGLAVAPNGDCYMFNHLSPGNYNGSSYIVSEYGFHLLRYNKEGTFISGTPIDMSVSSTTFGPDLNNVQFSQFNRNHKNGKFYIFGQYFPDYGDLTFGTTSINTPGPGVGIGPIFLASFNSSGDNIWVKQSTPAGYITNRYCKPVLDEQGNIYIGGDAFPYTVNEFNGYTFTNSMGDGMVAFVSSLDSNGSHRWTTNANTDGEIIGHGISYINNTLSLTGYYGREVQWGTKELTNRIGATSGADVYLARFNASTGAIVSLDSLVTSGIGNTGTAVVNDKNGNAYVGGRFSEQLYVDGTTLNSAGGDYDWFVAKFGSSNCNCTVPTPNYTYSPAGTNTLSFNYTGSTPYTSISWDFGDGSPAATTANPTHAYSTAGNYTVCVTVTNACGSNTYCMLVNSSGTSSISNIPGFVNINIYPNPAMQMIHIDHATAGTTLDVLNVTGTNMMQVTLKGNKDIIDVSNLASGMYLLRFTDKDGKQGSTRFVKQ